MNKIMIFVLAASAVLSGCKVNSSSASDESGNCNSAVISARNEISTNFQLFIDTQRKANLVNAVNACEELKVLLGNNSCKAVNLSTRKTVTVSYESVRKSCAAANSLLDLEIEKSRKADSQNGKD